MITKANTGKAGILFGLLILCLIVYAVPTNALQSQQEDIAPAARGWITFDKVKGKPYQVSYDNRSLKINGLPSLFISGSVHPPRATPPMWDRILDIAKQNGLNMIEVYVFWNFHEREEGKYYWEERGNLSLFIEKCAQHNLFVNLRIGPYVCAEWDYGGIPTWLGFKQGVEFRTYNDIWMNYMQKWFETVIDRLAPYFPKNGGPIVLVQVENELRAAAGTEGRKYIDWCGKMANNAVKNNPVPIIMCNGDSAPDTINTCNGNDCTSFIEEHGQSGRILIDQPALWTENEGGFQVWGESPSNVTSYFWGRTIPDITNAIARWFARGGSHMNYYMYYGGNHYGPWTGSSITHMYASDVNICPDMLPHEPKFSHLGRLHSLIAQYADIIVYNPAQMGKEQPLLWYNNATQKFEPGTQQYAYVYKLGNRQLVFIENDANVWVLTQFNGKNYDLPPVSVSLVDEKGTELFNTAKVAPSRATRSTTAVTTQPFNWRVWSEPFGAAKTSQFPAISGKYPQEQSSVNQQIPSSWPLTQYLWYERNVTVVSQPPASTAMNVMATYADGLLLFVDGVLAGTSDDHSHSDGPLQQSIPNVGRYFVPGIHQISILSESFGFDNGMDAGSTRKFKGITGDVTLGSTSLTDGSWTMRPALVGELLEIFTLKGSSKVPWSNDWKSANGKPVTWYQTQFVKPVLAQDEVLLFDATGMGRGHFYLNGKDMGRYWLIDMNDGSNKPTQHLYHIPTDWLVEGANLLTLGDVLGASDASQPRLMKRKIISGIGNSQDVTCPM